ncbi:M24 family metallopeptidase [Mycobacterium aquaticum]|uniref:Peptidase n=1 Tax=Mycobacterium aquaticum TaxID=1927124 RepID=A0A1X0B4P6_9MYCO|nr:M24 family metallopeptidase [Mycobacterium aquaticum]ORA37185.1 hypothetical protein BST13_08505 [Mycobacterium aquaticum]
MSRRSVDNEAIDEHRARLAALRSVITSTGGNGAVTMKQANLRYLIGYSTAAPGKAALVVTQDEVLLAVAESELGRAMEATAVIDNVHVFGWDEPLTVDNWWHGNRAQDGDALIDRLRQVTSEWGAARMRLAAGATKAGVETAWREAQRADVTDAQIAAAAMSAMVHDSGYEFPAFVVVGIDSSGSLAHSQWQRRKLGPGGVAFLEFSGGYDGYCAPVMRTIVREPVDDDVTYLFGKVQAILETLYQELKPGIRCSTVAKKCTSVLGVHAGVLFHYSYGYPVNIFDDQSRSCSWMSGPEFFITEANDERLEVGMTFHLPIVLRRFGRYAVGQSQTVRIVDDGVEVLTGDVPAGLLRVPGP